MKHTVWLVVAAAALLLTGCETRSISDSGYRHSYGWARTANPLYKGELTEMDVLGAAPSVDATEENIAKALASAESPRLKRGDRVLLIQSGAITPDHAMLENAETYFDVAPFSGVPPGEKAGLAASLRLRAAQGGCRFVVCYWGVLESAREDREGKAVSWVPIVGAFVPDEKQRMRIRLRALVVDVATGHWRTLTPEARDDAAFTSGLTRESSDQRLVETLKTRAYRTLVADLVKT